MKLTLKFKTPLTNGIFWGISGGLTLLFIRFIPIETSISEVSMLILFLTFLLLSHFTFRPKKNKSLFLWTFVSTFLTFMLIPIIAHLGLYLIYFNENSPKMTEPFFILLSVGLIVSLIMTILATKKRFNENHVD